jgi:hypothetical protein
MEVPGPSPDEPEIRLLLMKDISNLTSSCHCGMMGVKENTTIPGDCAQHGRYIRRELVHIVSTDNGSLHQTRQNRQ